MVLKPETVLAVVAVVYYIFKILSTNAFVMIKKEACKCYRLTKYMVND